VSLLSDHGRPHGSLRTDQTSGSRVGVAGPAGVTPPVVQRSELLVAGQQVAQLAEVATSRTRINAAGDAERAASNAIRTTVPNNDSSASPWRSGSPRPASATTPIRALHATTGSVRTARYTDDHRRAQATATGEEATADPLPKSVRMYEQGGQVGDTDPLNDGHEADDELPVNGDDHTTSDQQVGQIRAERVDAAFRSSTFVGRPDPTNGDRVVEDRRPNHSRLHFGGHRHIMLVVATMRRTRRRRML
jgi:hypothetical protein